MPSLNFPLIIQHRERRNQRVRRIKFSFPIRTLALPEVPIYNKDQIEVVVLILLRSKGSPGGYGRNLRATHLTTSEVGLMAGYGECTSGHPCLPMPSDKVGLIAHR